MSSNPKDPMTDTPGNVPVFVRPDPAYLPRAVQWTGANHDQVAVLAAVIGHEDGTLVVQGSEGKCGVRPGHWVVSIPYNSPAGSAVLVFTDDEFRKRWVQG